MVFFVSEGGGFTGFFKQRNRNNRAKMGPKSKMWIWICRKKRRLQSFGFFVLKVSPINHRLLYRQRMLHVQKKAIRHIISATDAISGLRMHKANLRLQIKQVLSYRQPVIRFQIGKLMITVTGMNVNVDTKRMLHNTVLNGW